MSHNIIDSEQVKFVLSRLSPDSWKLGAGRRSYVAYRDFGIADATSGKIKFIGARINKASDVVTGWHYHTCDLLVAYYTRGWIDIYYEPGKLTRVEAGTCVCIPKGMPHNEIRNSDDMELVEFYIGEMGTVACDEPPPGQPW